MARTRKLQATPETAEAGIKEIINTSVEKTIEEAATYVNVANFKLRDMFCDRLGNDIPSSWETIPTEHEPLLEEFKRQMDAAATVQPYAPQLPQVETEPQQETQPEISFLQDAPKPPKGCKLAKTKSTTKLTQGKTKKLKESDEKSKELNSSNLNVNEVLHARKGQKNGARLATIELAAEDVTYRKIKSEALKRKTAQLTSEVAAEEGLDPIQLLEELGLDSNSEILEDLRSQLEPALGKLDCAVTEIVDSAWVNGISLDAEFTALNNLLNYEE